MKKLITLTTALTFSLLSMASVQTVINSNDTGAGSLREEISNALVGDTIRFSPSIIASGSATISLQGEIAFSKGLTIVGLYNSTDTLYIDGGGNNRIFNISNATNVYLDSLILVGGQSSGDGGAILFNLSDSLFLSNSMISNSSATNGGGVYCSFSSTTSANTATYLHVFNSTITNNSASSNGGGVYSNSVSFSSGNTFSTSSVNIINSTIDNNSAVIGGGVYSNAFSFSSSSGSSASPNSTINIINSTISENSATSEGGGIYSNSFSSSNTANSFVTIENSTLYKNTSSGSGNSIDLGAETSSLDVKGSIVYSDNNGTNNINYDPLKNTFTSLGYNIFSDSLNEVFASTDHLSIDNTTLNLDVLQNNGGTTLTHLPLSGSVALNAGDPTDLSDSQNKQVVGVREIGSTSYCSTTGTDTQSACITYTWIDGNTYTASNNTATFNIVTAQGCDSLVTLDLTINSPNTGTDVQIACDTYTWIDGNTYTTNNNVATHTLTNVNGCDSVVTLDLTVNYSSTGTDIQTACDSYIWIDGNTYTSSNSTATHTLTNSAGCDSVVTLNLTINNSSTGTDTQTACDSYIWIDGNTYTTSNSTATHTITNSVGCDSVVTLNLTINNSSTGTDTQTACDSYTWIDGNTYTTNNNTAIFTLTNSVGCDSVVTLDLTINTVDISTTLTDVITIMANQTGATYQWVDCDNNNTPIPAATGLSYTATSNGNYACIVALNGCSSTTDCIAITSVGVADVELENAFSIYPNPTTGLFYLDMQSTSVKAINIYSVNGELVYSQDSNFQSTNELNITSAPGIYFVEIITPNARKVLKMVKE